VESDMTRIFTIALGFCLVHTAAASELGWGFKSPAFHYGNGYSTHVLSVEQLQFNRQQDLDKAIRNKNNGNV